jgi:hypothetical protein
MATQSAMNMVQGSTPTIPQSRSEDGMGGGVILGSYVAALLFPFVGFFMAWYLHGCKRQDHAVGVAIMGAFSFLLNLIVYASCQA